MINCEKKEGLFVEMVWCYLKTVFFTTLLISLVTAGWGGWLGYEYGFPLKGYDELPKSIGACKQAFIYSLPFGVLYGVLIGLVLTGPVRLFWMIWKRLRNIRN